MVRRAVSEMLYADDAGVVGVIVVAYQEFGLTV